MYKFKNTHARFSFADLTSLGQEENTQQPFFALADALQRDTLSGKTMSYQTYAYTVRQKISHKRKAHRQSVVQSMPTTPTHRVGSVQ